MTEYEGLHFCGFGGAKSHRNPPYLKKVRLRGAGGGPLTARLPWEVGGKSVVDSTIRNCPHGLSMAETAPNIALDIVFEEDEIGAGALVMAPWTRRRRRRRRWWWKCLKPPRGASFGAGCQK